MTADTAAPWRPRASAIGHYMSCDYRAAFDRLIESGELVLEKAAADTVQQAKQSSPNADFGTCTHFALQAGIDSAFPGPTADFAPDPEQWTNAARLHGGDIERTKKAVLDAATMAGKAMPKLSTPWLAESSWKLPYLQGHIDFLSPDFLEIGDLKTTSRPPPRNQPKVEHIVQLCAYHVLVHRNTGVSPVRGWLLYQDIASVWNLLVPVDFTAPGMVEFLVHVEAYARHLCTPEALETCVPRMGSHCSDGWCPYVGICRARIMPPAHAGREGSNPRQALPSTGFRL